MELDFFTLVAATSLGTLIGAGALYCMVQFDKPGRTPWWVILGVTGYGAMLLVTGLSL